MEKNYDTGTLIISADNGDSRFSNDSIYGVGNYSLKNMVRLVYEQIGGCSYGVTPIFRQSRKYQI